MVTAGIFPFKENSHGRAENRTQRLMISSQRLWTIDHEVGQCVFVALVSQYAKCMVLIILSSMTFQLYYNFNHYFLYSTNFGTKLFERKMCVLFFSTKFLWNIPCYKDVAKYTYVLMFFSLPIQPHVLMNFRGFPPGFGDIVADVWGWDDHEARLRCPDDVSGDVQEDEIPGGALSLNLLTTQTMVTTGIFRCKEIFPTVEPGIESGTSWLVVRDPDH